MLVVIVLFVVGNCVLWMWTKKQLKEEIGNKPIFAKGTVRGVIDRIATKEWLEKKRKYLSSRRSKI